MNALFVVLFVQLLVVLGLLLVAMFIQARDESVATNELVRAARRARLNSPSALRPVVAKRVRRSAPPSPALRVA